MHTRTFEFEGAPTSKVLPLSVKLMKYYIMLAALSIVFVTVTLISH